MTTSSEKDNVSVALSDLNQLLDDEKERLNEEAVQAMKDGEYDTATALIQFTKRLLGFQAEVEALIGKWEELDGIGDLAPTQVRHVVNTRVVQSKKANASPQPLLKILKGSSDPMVYCFHILDTIQEMGGVARNQDLPKAVNKRIKMLYPQFTRAKNVITTKGWTKKNMSSHVLEISEKGIAWLQNQKTQQEEAPIAEHITQKPEAEPPSEAPHEIEVSNHVMVSSIDDDFDQI